MAPSTRGRAAGLAVLLLLTLACGADESLEPPALECLEALGELAVSRRFPVEREGRLCTVTVPDGCTASRKATDGERTVCETVDLHEGRGSEAIAAELTISCRARFAFMGNDRAEAAVRVWGYLDKKMPRLVNETMPTLHRTSTLPKCATALFLPQTDRETGWFVRELTFFPGDDGRGRPLTTEKASWAYQLRRIKWERRPDAKREALEFLDDVFPLEFERAIRTGDPMAADWVRVDVPGAQRLTYEAHPTGTP